MYSPFFRFLSHLGHDRALNRVPSVTQFSLVFFFNCRKICVTPKFAILAIFKFSDINYPHNAEYSLPLLTKHFYHPQKLCIHPIALIFLPSVSRHPI